MIVQDALKTVVAGDHLEQEHMSSVMRQIMSGEATSAQIAGLLVALRMKGESVDEITGAALVMRDLASSVNVPAQALVDTCGTGGDGANIFNVSTASAFVAAAAGASVAKHGNRSVSSSSGSADVLEAAGVNLAMTPNAVARAISTLGVGFMFAPAHHGAMKHAIGPRRELGLRTIFNMLGPMTNPAGVKRQVIGVYDKSLCRPFAEVLQRLGSEHVLIVHAEDGLDEFSTVTPSHVAELKDGSIQEYRVDPNDYNLASSSISDLCIANAEESLALIQAVFSQQVSQSVPETRLQQATSIVLLNAGAAIYVSGLASDLAEGIHMADDAISSGAASEKLSALIQFSHAV